MSALLYKIIKNKTQYYEYAKKLEELVDIKPKSKDVKDEIELLTHLIEKYDAENNSFKNSNPVEILQSLIEVNDLKAKNLVDILGVSKGLVSDILHYKKGLSKEIIRILASHFKVSQEAFNRPYKLKLGYGRKREVGVN